MNYIMENLFMWELFQKIYCRGTDTHDAPLNIFLFFCRILCILIRMFMRIKKDTLRCPWIIARYWLSTRNDIRGYLFWLLWLCVGQ